MSHQVIFTDTLYHHGVKGQRWGVRRYRNEDGSLTNDGKERYNKRRDTAKKVAIGVGITGAVALGAYVVHKNRQYIRNKASKRQIEIGKKKVSNIVDLDIQSRINYVDAKNSKDIKGMMKEKKRMKTYRKAVKKITDTYSREAYKLKTGKYKKAKDFLILNDKPIDYLEDFAKGAAVGAGGGLIVRREINKKKGAINER